MGVPRSHGNPRDDNGEPLPKPRQEPSPVPRRPAPAMFPVPSQPQWGSPEHNWDRPPSPPRPDSRQASTSELFGLVQEVPQKETTPFYPRSPYAVAKLYAYWAVRNYREAYGIFASNGILLNHESPRRGETFVTRKITRAVGRIKMGLQDKLYMGNINSLRDWGFAGDYVEGMWRILQHDKPDEFVLATGEMHSVKEFLEMAFDRVGLDWEKYVECDKRYFRPTEVDQLLGDAAKARRELGWEPKVKFPELVALMVDADLELARKERALKDA